MLGIKPDDDTACQDSGEGCSQDSGTTSSRMVNFSSLQRKPQASAAGNRGPARDDSDWKAAGSDKVEAESGSDCSAPLSLTFTVEEAVQIMCTMEQQSSYGGLVFQSRMKMSPTVAVAALDAFISMRLIHSPKERVHIAASYAEGLQPTPKGLALLQSFCQKHGCFSGGALQMLMSEYNTMRLVMLPRGPRGTLQLSTALTMVLWRKMLGTEPNLYDPDEQPQPVVPPTYTECVGAGREFSEGPAERKSSTGTFTSPFFHRFFIHPSSNSTCQYWDSKGVRIFPNTTFERSEGRVSATEYRLKHCLAGKAMWQWIMECTDARSFQEAASIVKLFIDSGLAIAVTDKVSEMVTCDDNMPLYLSRGSFYRISARGLAICAWQNAAELFDDAVGQLESQNSQGSRKSSSDKSGKPSPAARLRKKTSSLIDSGKSSSLSSTSSSESDITEQKQFVEISELDWLFEDKKYCRKNVNKEFVAMLSLAIVLQEPGLRLLFAEKLGKWQCVEPLLFLEDYAVLRYNCLKMLKAKEAKDKMAYVAYTSTVWEGLGKLIYQYICVGAPNELNLNDNERKRLVEPFAAAMGDGPLSVSDKQVILSSLVEHLAPVQAQQYAHLEENIGRFAKSDVTLIEDLRQHIVGRMLYTTWISKEMRTSGLKA